MLKKNVKAYLEETGMPKTLFCKRLGISSSHLYKWLNDERNISDELQNDIKTYLSRHSIGG